MRKLGKDIWEEGFNPCFNGYSTLTILDGWVEMVINCGFNPCFNGYSTLTTCK